MSRMEQVLYTNRSAESGSSVFMYLPQKAQPHTAESATRARRSLPLTVRERVNLPLIGVGGRSVAPIVMGNQAQPAPLQGPHDLDRPPTLHNDVRQQKEQYTSATLSKSSVGRARVSVSVSQRGSPRCGTSLPRRATLRLRWWVNFGKRRPPSQPTQQPAYTWQGENVASDNKKWIQVRPSLQRVGR